MLTQDEVRKLFLYDEKTGVLIRRSSAEKSREWNTRYAGKAISSKCNNYGYMRVSVGGVSYTAHKLIWIYVHGKAPRGEIDHIDGDKTNNSLANLRDVSHEVNCQNIRRAFKNNLTGNLGVDLHNGKYRATIRVNKRHKHIGSFSNIEDASLAYIEAKRRHHQGSTI